MTIGNVEMTKNPFEHIDLSALGNENVEVVEIRGSPTNGILITTRTKDVGTAVEHDAKRAAYNARLFLNIGDCGIDAVTGPLMEKVANTDKRVESEDGYNFVRQTWRLTPMNV
jgi:hypothetical protein